MERRHRDAIRVNFMSLVNVTDLDLMVGALYEKRVFSDAMIEDYRDTSKSIVQRKRQLYLDLPRRGPTAFQNLLDALSENGYWDLVRSLDPDSALHIRPRSEPTHSGESSYLSLSEHRHRQPIDVNRNPAPSLAARADTLAPSPAARADTLAPSPAARADTLAPSDDASNGNDPPPPSAVCPPRPAHGPPPSIHVIHSTKFFEDGDSQGMKLYRTRGRNRGVLVLFSYVSFNGLDDTREGGLKDHDNLKYLFTELGFKVLSYIDLSYKETVHALRSLGRRESLVGARPECVFVVFASHGYQVNEYSSDTELRLHDGQLLSLLQVIEYFSNDDLPTLIGIPKVFIFQNCRGNKDIGHSSRHHVPAPLSPARALSPSPPRPSAQGGAGRRKADGVSVDGHVFRDEEEGATAAAAARSTNDRIYSDILIAHSTLPGYVSNRDNKEGSWYIQSLCHVFAAHAHNCHVERLFSLVDDHMSKVYRTQTSSTEKWGFNRLLYLHPGLYEDS